MFPTFKRNRHLAAQIVVIVLFTWLFTPITDRLRALQSNVITIDDSEMGTGSHQFNYVGSHWQHCTNCAQSVGVYGDSNSWNGTRNEFITLRFVGTQIKIYGVTGPSNGMAAVNLDDGAESTVDFFATKAAGDQLLWSSADLTVGEHNVKIRVTGTRSAKSKGNYIALDRADVTTYAVNVSSTPQPQASADMKITTLEFRVVDADYSSSLDRIVMLADSPSALHIYNPANGQDAVVNLSSAANRLSIGPTGKFAAVGQAGLIAYVDLVKARVVKTFEFPQKLETVVLANDWMYVEAVGPTTGQFYGIEIATGKQSASTGSGVDSYAQFRLRPDGKRLYGASRYGGIIVVDVSAGVPKVIGEHSGQFYSCNKLWVSQDGKRIFSGFGDAFRTGDEWELDVSPNGRLPEMKYARYIFHDNKAELVLAIPEAYPVAPCPNQGEETPNRLMVYQYMTLKLVRAVTLPTLGESAKPQPAIGHFVFGNAAGTKYYLILQANKDSGLLNDYAIAVGDLTQFKASGKYSNRR